MGIDDVPTIQIPRLKEWSDLSILDGDFFKRGIGGGGLLSEFERLVCCLSYLEKPKMTDCLSVVSCLEKPKMTDLSEVLNLNK
jgi:hypothetical protein